MGAVLQMDGHCSQDGYLVRSLYFDTPHDDALWEKIDGIAHREKFRIRCYNNDYGFLRLEKKVKDFNRGYKLGAPIERTTVERIVVGEIGRLELCAEPLLNELTIKCRTELLRPKVVVEYRRKAYVFGPGRTRVTLDFATRSSATIDDFFDPALPHGIADDGRCVLEVKYDGFLPAIVRDLVQVCETTSGANSKYVNARLACDRSVAHLPRFSAAWLSNQTDALRGE